MTTEQIRAVLKKVPLLGTAGVGWGPVGMQFPMEERARRLTIQRAELLESCQMCEEACDWLKRWYEPTKRRTASCHALKVWCERDLGRYVSTGAFIVAAVHSGFPWRVKDNTVMIAAKLKDERSHA